jgi:hypothetical protein
VAAAVAAVLTVRRLGVSGWLVGWLVLPAFSTLFMVKLRCAIGPYPCGFMSFTGGFTWHWLVGAAVFLTGWSLASALLAGIRRIGWWRWTERLGRGMTPLLGLWLAVLWEMLPVRIIHPPSYGGPCPDLPVICHDLPLFGFGGLAYWAVPFVMWAAVTMTMDVIAVLRGQER